MSFGREFNASDDRPLFRARTRRGAGRPVVEGKHLDPFRLDLTRAVLELAPDTPASRTCASYPRVAYREVASASNRLTLIAAIVPAEAVTTHTLFCSRTRLANDDMLVLCGLLNSFVANYLIRLRVSTHVTATLMARLPVPAIRSGSAPFAAVLDLSRRLTESDVPVERMPEYSRLQATVAGLYGLECGDLSRVLASLPLVDAGVRDETLRQFEMMSHVPP